MNKKLFFYASAILLVLLLAGCANASGANTVNITLTDFGIKSSRTTFEAGVPYHFVITNDGMVAHELMLMAPMDPDMAARMDMHELDEMAMMVVEEAELPSEARYTIDFTFPEDARSADLEFACHTKGHYEAGMKLPIAVR